MSSNNPDINMTGENTETEFAKPTQIPSNSPRADTEKSQEQPPAFKTVVFCVPTHKLTSGFSTAFLNNWTEIVFNCIINGYKPLLSVANDNDVITMRNKCLGVNLINLSQTKDAFEGQVEYDYIVWLDPNISLSFNDLKKLLESPHDITTAIYTYAFSQNNQMTNLIAGDTNSILEYYKKNGSFPFVGYDSLINVEKDKEHNRYIKVNYADMGLIVMKPSVYKKLEAPYFLNGNTKENYVAILTDVFYHCQKLIDSGFEIMADFNTKLTCRN